jgi:hypothetical protein
MLGPPWRACLRCLVRQRARTGCGHNITKKWEVSTGKAGFGSSPASCCYSVKCLKIDKDYVLVSVDGQERELHLK